MEGGPLGIGSKEKLSLASCLEHTLKLLNEEMNENRDISVTKKCFVPKQLIQM